MGAYDYVLFKHLVELVFGYDHDAMLFRCLSFGRWIFRFSLNQEVGVFADLIIDGSAISLDEILYHRTRS